MKSLRAVFIDLDETLIYTSRANYLAYQESCLLSGLLLDEKVFKDFSGMNSEIFLPAIFPGITEETIFAIQEHKISVYPDYFRYTTVNASLLALVQRFRGNEFTVLVTNASLRNVDKLLQYHELSEFFDLVLTGDLVANKKPAPDLYFLALEKLNLQATECVAFEDSTAGIESARAAGIHVFKVLNLL